MTEAATHGAAGGAGALRSHLYRLFAAALEYPDQDLRAALASGALADALREALAGVDPGLVEGADWAALADAGPDAELEVEYTRLFDVGTGGPPCPLHGGLYGGARMRVMEEVVRFYNHFGLTLAEAPRELPDHLGTQLEFLHFLAYREARARAEGGDPGPYARAQRDFLARHPARWVPRLRERLERNAPPPYLRELVRRLDVWLRFEAARLAAEHGAPHA